MTITLKSADSRADDGAAIVPDRQRGEKMRINLIVSALAALLVLSACDNDSAPQQNDSTSSESEQSSQQPVDKLTSMRPTDQVAFLDAFTAHDKAINAAPNGVVEADIRKVEDQKLCVAIEAFKKFHNWTAEVRFISVPDESPNEIQITVSLNGGLLGYLATAKVNSSSPLYAKIKTLKDGLLDGSDVIISGTVMKATTSIDAISASVECAGLSNFDVELTSIDQL